MESTPRARARKQLGFALALLVVAVAGYLVTRSFAPQVSVEDVSPGTVTSTPASPTSTPDAALAPVASGRQTIEGTYVCLPHRDESGPQTLECALGLRTDDGRHYALSSSSATSERAQAVTPTGARIRVTGSVALVEASSGDQWSKYAVVAVVQVESFAEIGR